MIELRKGDLLKADADALVNTVNSVGVMGKGIALQFKRAFPQESKEYIAASRQGWIKPGSVFIVQVNPKIDRELPHYIIHFATKDDWRKPSQIEWIRDGLSKLVSEVGRLNIRSIALPPLGCGHGGLAWNVVKPMIVEAFAVLPDVQVFLYSPESAPAAESMIHNESAPKMTPASALYLQLLKNYCVIEPTFTHLELQKLAYFLQEAGEPLLKLRFVKGQYGPFAKEIRHILERADSHWVTGYGDGTGGAGKVMMLKQDAADSAGQILKQQNDEHIWERLARVSELVEGYDYSEGVELLATVYYVAKNNPLAESDVAIAIQDVKNWNERKRKVFDEHSIADAWSRLHEYGWLNALAI